MLPKYLLADNCQEKLGKLYIVHNESPRFILEGSDDDFSDDQVMHWIDSPVKDKAELAQLIADAEDFLDAELMNQEELYDEMDD